MVSSQVSKCVARRRAAAWFVSLHDPEALHRPPRRPFARRRQIAEAALSFLGLGQQPPSPSWGSMLYAAQRFLTNAPWMAIWPGLAIFLMVLSLNLVGDGLRDALDPRER